MRRAHSALIGAFVLGGLAVLAAGLLLWFARHEDQRRYEYVSYFQGTANGLKVGGSVKLRGIKVGTITRVRLFSLDQPDNLVIGVYFAFDEERVRETGIARAPEPPVVAEAVRRGLRARLGAAKLLTGDRGLELDFALDSPVVGVRPRDATDDTPEIPLIAPTPGKASEALEDLMATVDEMDLPTLSASLTRAADQIGAASKEIGKVASGLDGKLDAAIGARAPWIVDLRRTLASVEKASRELGALAEYLRRNPSSLITGKPK